MEETYSKYTIATYLRDFVSIMNNACEYPNMRLLDIYYYYLESQGRRNEATYGNYIKMINTIMFMNLIRMYSIMYDNFFNYIKEEDLKNINFDYIFVDKNDINKFKNNKKDILKYIRNALNHNKINELCEFGFDTDSYVKINLKNTNPPFKVKFYYTDLLNHIDAIFQATRKNDITALKTDGIVDISTYDSNYTNEIKKIFFRRIHPKSVNGYSDRAKEILTSNKSDVSIKELIDEINVTDYHLSWEEVYAIKEKADFLHKNINYTKNDSYINKLDNINLIKHVASNTIPLGMLKLDQFNYLFSLLLGCRHDVSLSGAFSYLNQNFRDGQSRFPNMPNSWDYFMIDGVTPWMSILNLYSEYMFSSVIKDSDININGKNYNVNQIRNSYVHGRYFNSDKRIYLSDLQGTNNEKKKIINELKQKPILNIKSDELYNVLEPYYNELKNEYLSNKSNQK